MSGFKFRKPPTNLTLDHLAFGDGAIRYEKRIAELTSVIQMMSYRIGQLEGQVEALKQTKRTEEAEFTPVPDPEKRYFWGSGHVYGDQLPTPDKSGG